MPKEKTLIFFTAGVLICLLSPISIAQTPSLTFTQTQKGQEFLCAHTSLKKAYAQLGLDVKFQTMPNKRALKESNSGNADGEMLRVAGIERRYTNLIRVPFPICSNTLKTIAKEHVNATTYKELSKFKVGITFGFVGEERLVEMYKLDAYSASGEENLIKMFQRGHLDVIFLSEIETENLLSVSQEKGYKVLEALNKDVFFYHYIHKKNKELVPLVTEELKKLEKKGLIDLKLRRAAP